jgi:hypothetical protein
MEVKLGKANLVATSRQLVQSIHIMTVSCGWESSTTYMVINEWVSNGWCTWGGGGGGHVFCLGHIIHVAGQMGLHVITITTTTWNVNGNPPKELPRHELDKPGFFGIFLVFFFFFWPFLRNWIFYLFLKKKGKSLQIE